MNYFLVDYENVKTHGLDGISKLNDNDIVCIFYSDNADTLSFRSTSKDSTNQRLAFFI